VMICVWYVIQWVGCDDLCMVCDTVGGLWWFVYGMWYSGWAVMICVWYVIQWVGYDDFYIVSYTVDGWMMICVQWAVNIAMVTVYVTWPQVEQELLSSICLHSSICNDTEADTNSTAMQHMFHNFVTDVCQNADVKKWSFLHQFKSHCIQNVKLCNLVCHWSNHFNNYFLYCKVTVFFLVIYLAWRCWSDAWRPDTEGNQGQLWCCMGGGCSQSLWVGRHVQSVQYGDIGRSREEYS